MKKALPALLAALLLLSACATAPAPPGAAESAMREPSSGELAWVSLGGIETALVEGRLTVVRADLRRAQLMMLNPPSTSSITVAELAAREKLSVVINAAMFAKDYATSIGYMRNFEVVNNPRISAKLLGWLFFNPKDPSSPAVKIGSTADLPAYHSAFQTHRMIDETGRILWKKGASIYRQVNLVGVDGEGRVLFFHHSPLGDVHDLVEKIQGLGLGLRGLLYLDGGSHATLHLARELGRGANTWLTLPNLLGLRAGAP